VRWWTVLSIAKLRVGQEAYQLSGVAQSLDGYYTGAGEAHGVWLGGGADRLGLGGDVDPDDLRAVLAGLGPGWGGLTPNGDPPRPHAQRVPGFDLTFKVPKSASVLYAVSDDPRVQGAVIEAGEAAMRAAVGWLEREAIRVRRGSHNQAWRAAHPDGSGPRQLRTSGVVAASFRHRTSRAGDPYLHWHVLVANMAEGTDGRWSALHGVELYRHARAAGELFQAAFRQRLTQALGVEWRPGRHVAEIAGIPQRILDAFSKRAGEVEAWLAATGTPDTPEGRQTAVLATRRHKPEVEHVRFDAGWKTEAAAAGWGPDAADRLVSWSQRRAGRTAGTGWRLEADTFDDHGGVAWVERVVDADEWIAHLLRTDLTGAASTFTEPGVIQAVAARQGTGATVETIERIAARVLASHQVLAVDTPDGEAPRWTSRELVDVEARFVATVTSPTAHPPLPQPAVEAAVMGRPSLGGDQLAAVRAISADGHPVAVLVGPAGTGKTYTLDALRAAFQHAGHIVVGAAPSARAALELAAGASIPARTLHGLLTQWRSGHETPQPDSLLIIDEAGMADIRTLEAIVSGQVATGGRVLLVGDHRQLPEVGAGGGFAAAATHAACVVELTVNRRQHQPWEQAALAELRDGSVPEAVDAYLTHGRVVVTDDPDAMVTAAVDHWLDARHHGYQPVLLAGTNDLVDRLNHAVVTQLVEGGELGDDTVVYGAGTYRVGERVVVRRNSTHSTPAGQFVDVANGHAGHIIAAEPGRLTVRLDRGGVDVTLDPSYLARGGRVSHGYALTTHRAQGGTWDVAIAVGVDGLYREGAYVQLSRGAAGNWLIVTDTQAAAIHHQLATDLERHDTGLTPPDEQPSDTAHEVTARASRSRAKQLAHSLDPDVDFVNYLATTRTLEDLEARHVAAVAAERIATDRLGDNALALAAELARIDHVACHLTIGAAVSPADRHNVGTVTALDDTPSEALVRFTSADGHAATRRFAWTDLRVLEPATERSLPHAAQRRLDALTATYQQRIDDWNAAVRSLGIEPGDADRYRRAIHERLDRAAYTLAADRPAWLTTLLGERPADVAGATAWNDAVRDVATWRTRHHLPDNTPGVGPRPTTDDAAGWDQLQSRLGLTRTWLATSNRIHLADTITPSHHELLDRRRQLDALFDAAPSDWRPTVTQLQAGQLTLDDTTDLLKTAVEGQQARRHWILANWPHIVEYQQINHTLTTATWGPNPQLLTELLTQPLTATLTDAIQQGDPWLRAALCTIADHTTTLLNPAAIEWLEHVAADRAARDVPPSAPLDWPWWTQPNAPAADIEPSTSVEADTIDL
jgi:conjugative relaxase-like TrwC/TraI family protein